MLPIKGQSTNAEVVECQTPNSTSYTSSFTYRAFSPIDIQAKDFSLTADSGSLKHDITIKVTQLTTPDSNTMPSGMENVGAQGSILRLLPNGEHFSDTNPALISLRYDPALIPTGYHPTDIFTFYYDEQVAEWRKLQRVSVDTISHTITSYTTHFTDFANAVIKVPEMPESKAFVPTTMTDLPEANPLQGIPMIETPNANNRATAELTYPIELPQGRQGMQPNVNLHYSGATNNGTLGVGWTLPTPAITIDTRWGVPRYAPQYETEQYIVNGEPILLRNANGTALSLPYQENDYQHRKTGAVQFFARNTKNQDRVIRYGTNPSNYYWAVTDRNGITTYYGRTFNPDSLDNKSIDENSIVRTANGCIAYWAATASVDIHGNYILYTNEKYGNNVYIKQIDYTGNITTHAPPVYRVQLQYREREDITTSGRLGVLQTENRLLCHLLVQYLDPNKKHPDYTDNLTAYYLQYTEPKEVTLYKSRLAEVVKLDSVHDLILDNICSIEQIKSGEVERNKLTEELLKEAETNGDEKLYDELQKILSTRYGKESIPASTTKFSYADAPLASELFSIKTILPNTNDIDLLQSNNNGWSIGGTATVGVGGNVFETTLSGGGNYSYSRSKGESTTMLLDLNGDGLTDIVYEQNGIIYFKRQTKSGNSYSFANPERIRGLNRLSREITNSHSWGLQLSLCANLSYTNPYTTSYTDTYFTDVNADGLPDLIDGDNILINHLVNGIPTFEIFNETEPRIKVHNSHCGEITFDGEVDEHIECEVKEILIDSISLEDYFGINTNVEIGSEPIKDTEENFPEKHYYDENKEQGYNINKRNTNTSTPKTEGTSGTTDATITTNATNSDILPLYNETTDEDTLVYRIEDGKVKVYRLEYICTPTKTDPIIETVQVWVAPKNGTILLTDSISLLQDTSTSRNRSITADGVEYMIQVCNSITTSADENHLHAESYNIIKLGDISPNDYTPHLFTTTQEVRQGDIIMYRLRSKTNNRFDKTKWQHKIQYQGESTLYDSQKDYVCSGNNHFQALNGNSSIILTITGANEGIIPVQLYVRKADNHTSDIVIDTIIRQENISIQHIIPAVKANDSIYITLQPLANTAEEPHWGDIHITPHLQYISDFPTGDDEQPSVHDTISYYPDVQIIHSSAYPSKSPYRKLFGSLHKGWGFFAYRNEKNNDTIIVDSLVNTQLLAAERVQQDTSAYCHNSDAESFEPDSTWQTRLDNAFTKHDIFNPLSENNYWVPMRADSRTWQWIAYGDMGCVGKAIHSNARVLRPLETIENDEIEEYDSSLPFARGATRKNNFVRKQSRSVQNNISWGAPILINEFVGFGSYSAVVDYMDMNGDGYPDFVGKSGIQYSTPWGGIGKLLAVEHFTPFESSNTTDGISFSACPAELKRLSGNKITDGRFFMNATYGGSGSNGYSSTKISYIDVNNDGLPDKVDVDKQTVRYNLGYQFTEEYPFTASINQGYNIGGSVSGSTKPFSIGQVSISGGVGVSYSVDNTGYQLADINGDGLPDKILAVNNQVKVAFGKKISTANEIVFDTWKTLSNISNIGKNNTTNKSSTLSVTGGFTLLGTVKVNVGIQASPISKSVSKGEVTLTDMNGDGLLDYVEKADNQISVRYNKAGRANLLTEVTNPTGTKIILNYTLSPPTTEHRGRIWQLTRIENIDSQHPITAARRSVIQIEYDSAYYDNYEKTDYGYSHVRTIENNELIKDEYYHNRSFLQNGELKEDLLSDNDGNKYIRRRQGKRYIDINTGTETDNVDNICEDADVRVSREGYWTEYYEKEDDPQIITYYNVMYDEYYNIIKYMDKGDVSDTKDDYVKEVTYLPNTANNMVSLPKTETVIDASTNILRSSLVNYNPYGKPAHIHTLINDTTKTITHITYDDYGNITGIIYPTDVNGDNNWTSYDFDSITYSQITAIDNPFRERTLTDYDYRWQSPLSSIDPAGNTIRYSYDYQGRLIKITAPEELKKGEDYTIRYTYNFVGHNLKTLPTYLHTHVYKELYDPDFVQKEVTLYDKRGKILQKKHYSEVNGIDCWVVDGAEDWDVFGRVIATEYPFKALLVPQIYEPINNVKAIIRYDYDILDRLTRQVNADGSKIHKYYLFDTDQYGIKRFKTQITDENGITTSTLTSPQNWLIEQEAGDSSKTRFTYTPIGELLTTTDADGYQTRYSYDLTGRVVSRIHPDAGKTTFEYDGAGNIIYKSTDNLAFSKDKIQYIYKYSRLFNILYPYHSENNVTYSYNSAGQISVCEDGTGSEVYEYDVLGNISQTLRRIVIPTENNAYVFLTNYKYDSFGRMREIIYPDGEAVRYGYTTGGLLKSVEGTKQGYRNTYLKDVLYDEQGRKEEKLFGNGVRTRYSYDSNRQWLTTLYSELPNATVLQDINYKFDDAGNILSITQQAPAVHGILGGVYSNDYIYDKQYRLTQSDGNGGFAYSFKASYSPAGRMGSKLIAIHNTVSDLLFGYNHKTFSHQPRTIYDPIEGTLECYWDANGNLSQIIGCKSNKARLHDWDEENRLRFVLGEKYAGYYGYDAKGERVYKLTGTSGIEQVNAGYSYSNAVFDWCVMYPNPYIVITPKGYTKHYYAGAERIATVLGGGGFEDQKYPVVSLDTQHDKDIINAFNLNYKNYDPFNHEKRLSDPLPTATTDGNTLPELDYQCNAILLEHLDILSKQDMLLGILKNNSTENSEEKEIFYFHGDHLGSASWITETNGKPIQYIHYAPYGELIDNQQTINYDERYKFTGKERDAESGYDYFGARYYASPFSFWLSVDPLADKYPAISPYAYCTWNPIKFIDPDGKVVETGWDMINVGMDAVSLNENIASGNVPEAIVDGVCLIYDLAATAIPGYPASAGTLKNTIKTGVSNASVDIVNKGVQVVKKLLTPTKYN